ncbi:MAG: putative DNA-binding domain-containing protein [Steroidobacteraceae bacterium]
MPSLRNLQTQVMNALMGGEAGRAAALIAMDCAAPAPSPAQRLAVYRNNVHANFLDSLRSSYPAIRRLVGEDYFRQAARDYHRENPSRNGDLLHVGRGFPAHLAKLHPTDQYRYLADVARLEWLCEESLLAAEHAALDLERLRGVAPCAYGTLRFEMHPALRLFESPFPALRIWEANVASDAEPEPIDLDAGADCLAITRVELKLTFHRLSRGEFSLLDSLRGGDDFSEALEHAGACDEAFDAGAALRRFVAAQAIVDFAVPANEETHVRP